MKSLMLSITSSSKELTKTRNIVLCGLLIAMKLVLDVCTITVTPYLHIGFSFLASAAIGMFFGPVVGGICGGLADIISFIIRPTGPFYFGYTILAIISGSLYGFLLYKKKVTLLRCIIVELCMMVFINLLAGTYLLTVLYGKSFTVLLPARFIKNLCQLPVNVLLLYFILTILEKIEKYNS